MKTLPEELTPALLSLVLGYTVTRLDLLIVESAAIKRYSDDIIYTIEYDGGRMATARLNIDTLTRLMKVGCCKQTEMLNISYCRHFVSVSFANSNLSFTSGTEFEAIIKATHWVANEKGLL